MKVKKITPKGKNNYGEYSFIIDFEDDKGGFYNSKTDSPLPFIEGQEAPNYIIKEIPKKSGGTFNKVELKTDSQPQRSGGGGGGKPKNESAINASVALGQAVALCVGGKIGVEQVLASADKFHKWLMERT